MSEPKRHHWWPQLQSTHWTSSIGLINVVRPDGTTFTTSPKNIGVESELYTRFGPSGEKNREIETWFSQKIESPFAKAFPALVSLNNIQKRPCFPTREQRSSAESIGMKIGPYQEILQLSDSEREIITNYAAALLVRNPTYLSKLKEFHAQSMSASSRTESTNLALENMLYLYSVYRKAMQRAALYFILAEGDHEFLFSDAGITAREPWSSTSMPFDIHLPLTPKLSVEVLPIPGNDLYKVAFLDRLSNQAVAKQNRLVLHSAQRFVFCRSAPPINYIKKYFGVPAPAAYGHRYVNGRFETMYDRSRDR